MPRALRQPDPSLRKPRGLAPAWLGTGWRPLEAIPCRTDVPDDVFLWADPSVSPELIMRAIKRIKSRAHYAKPEVKAAKAARDASHKATRSDPDAEVLTDPIPISERQKRLRLVYSNGRYDLRMPS